MRHHFVGVLGLEEFLGDALLSQAIDGDAHDGRQLLIGSDLPAIGDGDGKVERIIGIDIAIPAAAGKFLGLGIVILVVVIVVCGGIAAGHEGESHHSGQQQREPFFHCSVLLIFGSSFGLYAFR